MLQTTRNQALDLVVRTTSFLFEDSFTTLGQTMEYMSLGYTDVEPDSPDAQLQAWKAPGRAVLTVEGQTYFSNTKYRDYPSSITFRKYTSRITWTEEDLHWLAKKSEAAQVNEISSLVVGHVQSLIYEVNNDATRFFYLGHGTSFYTPGDGVALYSGSHTMRDGTTASNIFSTGDTHRPFSGTALVDAITLMNRFKDQNGIQMLPVRNIKILCSIEDLPVVQKEVESKYGPNTPNLGESASSIEAFRRRGVNITYQALPYMPTAYKKYWFLVDLDRAKNHLFMCWMWKPRMADDTTPSNGTQEQDGSVAMGPACLGWQFTFSSTGSGATI